MSYLYEMKEGEREQDSGETEKEKVGKREGGCKKR
jgi:hypothetical protein